jgi:hypothetical protein
MIPYRVTAALRDFGEAISRIPAWALRINRQNCRTCGREIDVPFSEASSDCGGECFECCDPVTLSLNRHWRANTPFVQDLKARADEAHAAMEAGNFLTIPAGSTYDEIAALRAAMPKPFLIEYEDTEDMFTWLRWETVRPEDGDRPQSE